MTSINEYVVKKNRIESWGKAGPLLQRLDLELTERCNNRCIHCSINRDADDFDAREKELTTEQVKRILAEAAALGCLTVRLTGGEPLLRDDFEELYVFARKKGMRVLLFTNATLISHRLAELFSCIPPLDKIEITMYGMRQSSYEKVTRVSGSFSRAWEGIHLLLEKRIPFVVKGALLPPNRDEIDEFETWASGLPWSGRGIKSTLNFNLRVRRDSEKKNRRIRKLRPEPFEVLQFDLRQKEKYLNGLKEFCTKFATPPNDILFTCQAGSGSGCVDAYGGFYPCMVLKHPDTKHDCGQKSLRDALTRFFPRVRQTRAKSSGYRSRCARCFLHDLCEQCPALSWTEHGTLDSPVEHLCELTHLQAVQLGLLDEGEKAWEVDDWKQRIEKLVSKQGRLF